ncbi:MAG: DNA methyltransferase [Acidimicrobiia bacterium]
MAKIDDLLDDVPDPKLRSELRNAVNEMRAARTFGLVFEDHIPEEVALPGLPVRKGSIVQNRTRPDDTTKYEVIEVDGDEAQIRPVGNGEETTTVPVHDLMVVRRFGEPIYPGLTQVSEVRRGPDDKPAHAVINAENFHALQMLTYTHAGKVDVIYIDPPYNTGDKSWKYNNRFVDANDQWRHSKWLSMMEKRLRLARILLKPDGVLIVTIDEHEVHHLGVMLEQMFPEARRQMVTIVINAAGVQQGGFYRVEEHALFCFFGGSFPRPGPDDYLADEGKAKPPPIWRPLNRYSGTNVSAEKRPGLVYPVFVDSASSQIVGTGPTLAELRDGGEVAIAALNDWRPSDHDLHVPDSAVAVWPFKGDGSMATWELSPESLMALVEEGFVRARRRGAGNSQGEFSLSYVKAGNRKKVASGQIETIGRESDEGPLILGEAQRHVVPKTVWKRTKHDAGKWGKRILREFLGSTQFDFPKSPYAVLDTLAPVLRDNADAVVLDFFAGSGTTLHATLMLNASDGGRRQCILITNNDLSDSDAMAVHQAGKYKGDAEYEAAGIFQSVTRPRVEAAVTGRRPDGALAQGKYDTGYLDSRSHSDGFEENVVFLLLDYLDPDVVSVGRQYAAIAPLLWLAAGSVGRWADRDGDKPWSAPESSNYTVLFDEDRFGEFKLMVEGSDRISHVWLVTNSSQGFAEMRAQLPERLEVQMLYRDYLSNFRVNTAETFS